MTEAGTETAQAARGATGANLAMLRQFYSSLSALLALCPMPAEGAPERQVHREVAAVLSRADDPGASDLTWRAAYRAEQLMTALLPWPHLRAELAKRVAEARALQVTGAAAHEAAQKALLAADPPDEPAARALLLRVLNDTQWRYTQKIEMRKLAELQLHRLIWAFIGVLSAFIAAILFAPGLIARDWGVLEAGAYAGLFTAVLAGAVGAGFSALRSSGAAQADTIEDMEIAASRKQIAMRLLVGGGAATVLYFLFETGLLEGAVTPELAKIGFTPLAAAIGDGGGEGYTGLLGTSVPNKDLSLLVVWSVLAGFSEMMVPNLLAKISSAASVRKSGGDDGAAG